MHYLCHWFCVFVEQIFLIYFLMQFFCTPYAFLLHFFCTLLVNGLSLTFGLLQVPVVHEIKQAWCTCEILFKYVIYLGYLSWAKVYIFMHFFWYIYSMIHETNWVLHICVMIWLCISLSVKPSGFQNFLIKFDEPFIKLQIFYMHFFYISYAFLMHFLFISYALLYALFMHSLCTF